MDDKPKLRPEPLDYTLAALAPVFVIGMIGSLVYFVIAVLYRGDFPTRVMWILGLFTIAAVLIARIAIEQSRAYSIGYMVGLGAAVLVTAPAYLAGQSGSMIGGLIVLFVMMIVVAFLADRITFDCTSMNERSESSGIGLLQSLGLFRSDGHRVATQYTNRKSLETTAPRKHNPGVWVLYFSLLALPLFALGQLFVDSDANRAFCFRMLVVYLFCSLCLLVMIALLTLRRYLRERNIEMEMTLVIRWLATGVVVVFVLLLVFAVLPIPSKSLVQWDLPFELKDRDDLKANRFGWGNEGVNDNNPNAPQADKGQKADEANSEQGEKPKNPSNDSEPGKKPGDGSGDSKSGEESKGKDQSNSKPSDNQSNKNDSQGAEKSDESKDKSDKKSSDSNEEKDRGDREKQKPDKDQQGKKQDGEKQANEKQQAENKNGKGQPPPNQQPARNWSLKWNPSSSLQWLVLVVLLVIAMVYGFLHRDKIRQFLALLFGRRAVRNKSVQSIEEVQTVGDLCPPFASFGNPFSNTSLSREQAVSQMFQAIQSWGYEHRVIRNEEETPDEYVRRLARKFPEQLDNLKVLGFLYSRIAYARGKVSNQEIGPLRDLWKWLQASI